MARKGLAIERAIRKLSSSEIKKAIKPATKNPPPKSLNTALGAPNLGEAMAIQSLALSLAPGRANGAAT